MKCCVPLCEDDSVLHCFPTANEKQCHLWLERIGDEELVEKGLKELQKHYRICDSHFEQVCHKSDSDELIPGALPTLHLPGSRSDEYVGQYSLDSITDNGESTSALGMIVDDLNDSTQVTIYIDSDVEEEDLTKRYSTDTVDKTQDDSEVTINRPEDTEIVTRYSSRCEQESDDEIILKYPNDDDVIKRYLGEGACCPGGSRPAVGDDEPVTDDYSLKDSDDGLLPTGMDNGTSSVNQNHVRDSDIERSMRESSDSTVSFFSSTRRESESEMSVYNEEDSMSDDEEDILQEEDCGELNSVSEEFDDSCYESVDADDALRAATKPGCSSPRNHNITVYNLCYDKKFLSSISIDSPVKDPMPFRGNARHRDFLHNMAMNAPLTNSIPGGESRKSPSSIKKSRIKTKSKNASRNDNLMDIILSLEKISQTVEAQCIAAKRSLRKSCSHNNILRTGLKLRGEVTPLLNTQLSLVKKIRTNVP